MIRPGVRAGILALAVSFSWTGSAVEPPRVSGSSSWAERWLYNPRERTEAARESLDAGEEETFMARLDAARRLAPDDPTTLYNAGTGRLVAEIRPKQAAELLERAAERAPTKLAPHALFNLGNARLADGRPEAAISAYRDALRLAPDLQPAKHNLEVALGRLERKQTDRAERPAADPGDEAESREQDPGGGRPDPERSHQTEGRGAGPGATGTAGAGPAAPTLPRFDEQADMTAAQAAALLEAIENLERQQRLQGAIERAERAGTSRGKDW